ncbi:MAG: ATP-binding protein, partial [Planctomycetaceae bacterium]|nr:ATP-binding protein [Planctomycetaceae bacterium]
QMPIMDGLQLLHAIQDEFPMIPVVLMTAVGSEELAADALRAGAASYVPKRRLARDLIRTVVRIVQGVREDVAASSLMHSLQTSQMHFVLSNNLPVVMDLVVHIQTMLRCVPLRDETERLRVGLALEAALLNALYHGNLEINDMLTNPDDADLAQTLRLRLSEDPYRSRHIDVQVELNRDQACFVIRDDGQGFDHAAFDSTSSLTGAEKSCGRGLTLIHAVMDEVTFNESGNQITMIKRRYEPESATTE